MNILPKSVTRVVESFERLPGIGPKTAQRLAFYLLHVPEDEIKRFADSLTDLKSHTVLCSVCKNVTETDPCSVCSDPRRDHTMICLVEQPTDVLSIERTGAFHGVYHVLHGSIDPLNNIGPDEIYLADLLKRIKNQTDTVKELIFAMNPTMEGEATAMYIQKQLQGTDIKITRLAHGIPIGGDIEYADEVTLKRALEGRRDY
ncbi:MAG: recombination mediator RecR [Microgenomates group bacterium]